MNNNDNVNFITRAKEIKEFLIYYNETFIDNAYTIVEKIGKKIDFNDNDIIFLKQFNLLNQIYLESKINNE